MGNARPGRRGRRPSCCPTRRRRDRRRRAGHRAGLTPDAPARADRRDELGKHRHLLSPAQRAGARAAGRPAFGPAAALVGRLRRDRRAAACAATGTAAGAVLVEAARRLEAAGAEALVLCTNTMHKLADRCRRRSASRCCTSPMPPARRSLRAGCRRPALLATRFTMEEPFYAGRLRDALRPGPAGARRAPGEAWCMASSTRSCAGACVRPESRRRAISPRSRGCGTRGADCVILGCTEIGMLIAQADLDLPVFDTTRLHAEAAMDFALKGVG